MRPGLRNVAAAAVLLALVFSPVSGLVSAMAAPSSAGASVSSPGSASNASGPAASSHGPAPATASTVSAEFDARVHETAGALAEAGLQARSVRLPYVGTPARVEDGAVVPGPEVAAELSTDQGFDSSPAPTGLAYYGESDPSGTVETTVVNASTLAGSLTVDSIDGLYLDVDTPDMWGAQLNTVLGNTEIQGVSGYQFWVQNVFDFFEHNDTINLGEDTWNFSSPGANIPDGTSTILAHDPNGSVVGGVYGGVYVGLGPWIRVTEPFTIALYVNSSVTPAGDQELWYNYSVASSGEPSEHGNYDWIVFNSRGGSGTLGPPTTAIAPFQANGTGLDPIGLPNDFEFDFPIGGYNGADMDVLAANLTATLEYCPVALAPCTGGLDPVPAAEDFGGETGETGSGLSVTYTGTTALATAGPAILRGLWGFAGAPGSASGETAVTNALDVSGSPDPSGAAPYLFVFLGTNSLFDDGLEWAPDVPVWYLAPGTYSYDVLLADYAEVSGTLIVGSAPTSLAATLEYSLAAGVYTPLWALSNPELAGISSSGNGTVGSQFVLFNNPTSSCFACGAAPDAGLSAAFASWNDFDFPTFAGILLDGTTGYVSADAPVSFDVYTMAWGVASTPPTTYVDFDLQIQLVSTEHVTIAHDAELGGWPAMYETPSLAGFVNATENPFPQANLMIWNSTGDLVAENNFVLSPTVPAEEVGAGVLPAVTCYGCVSPDGLLLYGGTNNTVWGNSFSTLPNDAADADSLYADLAEAENGDLVYNNNFSLDNPTVYLPFDIYTDACPDGYAGQCGPLVPPNYHDRWNVSSQPASEVSETVNGYALSGNILGPSCPTQGGNLWSTYGDSLNSFATLPFVNTFYYGEIQSIFPANNSSAIQPSIRVGGDYVPLSYQACKVGTLETLRFHAAGHPKGALWSVAFPGGEVVTSTTAWVNASVVEGTVDFAVSAPGGYGVARIAGPRAPTFSSANVTGRTTLTVRFGPLEVLTFTEATSKEWPGLAAGTPWTVTLLATGHGGPPGRSASTTGTSVAFTVAKGTSYRFTVATAADYRVSPARGSVTMPAHDLTKNVRFRPIAGTLVASAPGPDLPVALAVSRAF